MLNMYTSHPLTIKSHRTTSCSWKTRCVEGFDPARDVLRKTKKYQKRTRHPRLASFWRAFLGIFDCNQRHTWTWAHAKTWGRASGIIIKQQLVLLKFGMFARLPPSWSKSRRSWRSKWRSGQIIQSALQLSDKSGEAKWAEQTRWHCRSKATVKT